MTERRIAGLAVTVEGSGPALLFLHGIGSSRHGFAAQVDHFKSRYTCIVPDAPGYGDSDDVERIDGMDGYATAFEALLDPFGPAAIVGVSFGGVIAARMTMRGRTPIRALVLADTSRGSGVDPVKAQAMRLRAEELDRVGAHAFAAARARRLVSDDAPGDLVDRVGAAMASAIRLPGYAQAADAMAGTDHSEQLGQINCPTLVVVGEHDAVCPPAEAELIASAIPGALLATIAGAGHLSYQERPSRFNDAIDRFLDRHHLNPVIPTIKTNRSTTMSTIDLDKILDESIATRESRIEDWDTLAFQAKAGDEFRRAQVRYVGSGGTGNHESDRRILPAEHFTFSNMRLPVGAIGPEHTHHDAEEVFFVLEGELEVTFHDPDDGTVTASRQLGYRDLIKVPVGIPRSLRNVGDGDALFCVIIGAGKPQIPTYPPTSPMSGITRD